MPVISPYFDQITILINKVFSRRNFWIYLIAILLLITLPINTPGSKFYLNNITVVKIRGDYFFHALTFIPWAFFMVAMKHGHGPGWSWGFSFPRNELLQYLLPTALFTSRPYLQLPRDFPGNRNLIFLMTD
jgi:hypothetical protein